MVKVTAARCKTCKDIIYSRARRDYRTCSCGDTGIDGGFDCIKLSFKKSQPELQEIEVRADRYQLYEDWNHNKNNFGIIKYKES